MNKSTDPRPLLALPLGILLSFTPCHAERVESVASAPAGGAVAGVGADSPFVGSGASPWGIAVPALDADLGSPAGGVAKSGVVFPLPVPVTAAQLAWEPVAGGYAARVRVSSGQANRLRAHLAMQQASGSIRLRVQGNLDASPVGPVDGPAIRGGGVWLPVTSGGTADLEIAVDGSAPPDTLDFKIDAVNVIIADGNGGDLPGATAQSLGYTAHKEYDVACWSGNSGYAGLSQAASATAKVHFIQDGGSFICSGTLLNDKGNTKTPWFATANHCIPNQATADTASFEWFFQATSCGGSATDSRHTQTYGGAKLLYTDFKFEASFLKLNKSPPSGVYFIGWDTAIHVGDEVWGVHHPEGDHTMASKGKVTSLLQTEGDTSQGGTHLLDNVTFTSGGTESGSSGSGLFSVVGSSVYWKGTLFGGPVGNYQLGSYSHLQNYYSNIKQWLEPTLVPAPTLLFAASQAKVDFMASVTLNWSSANATSCGATTSDGWSGGIPTTGSATLTLSQGTAFTINCTGPGGQAGQSLTVGVNPAPTAKTNCLLDWAEDAFPTLLPPPAATQFLGPYTYRHYGYSNAYAGVSSVDNHVYYKDPAGVLSDIGALPGWLAKAGCL